MKEAFRKDDREFAEMIFKNAAQQDLGGNIGSEMSRDVIIDQWGIKEEVSYRVSAIRTDENGIPYVYNERGGKVLSCGHVAHSLGEVAGKCLCGSTVCVRCQLYTCEWCGATVCDRCAVKCKNGTILCQRHEVKRKLLVAKQFLLG